MKPEKAFKEHLTHIPTTVVPYENSAWILKGSEDMLRYPAHACYGGDKDRTKGIITFGTKKINGKTCVSIGNEDARRAEELGWTVTHVGTAYAYLWRE